MKNIKKKGQEEIVGFVVIVVIVAVVFLVILGLYLRQATPATQKESIDVGQFLDSAMEYTSECKASPSSQYFSLGELVKECYDKSSCLSGEGSCSVLNRTLQGIMKVNWKYGPDRPFKGYIFNSSYFLNSTYSTRTEEVLFITQGNCTTERIGGDYFSPAQPGSITSSLEICL
jgi:hypothetical protein